MPPASISGAGETYARQLEATVTALGVRPPLLDVKEPGLATGGLDRPGVVRGGVVAASPSVCIPTKAPPSPAPR